MSVKTKIIRDAWGNVKAVVPLENEYGMFEGQAETEEEVITDGCKNSSHENQTQQRKRGRPCQKLNR